MTDIPKEDLERIEKKLESIEQKIGSKWMLPIIVALISGIIGLATVVVQVRLERSSSQERMEVERKLQRQAEELSGHRIFYDESMSLVGKINGLFQLACTDAHFSRAADLNELCINCMTHLDRHRPHYGEEKEFIKKVREYDDLVQTNLTDFESGKNTEQDKQKALESSKQKYAEVLSSLGEFYKQYVKNPQSDGR